MKTKLPIRPTAGRALDIDEIRLVADLRVMHAKVDELFQLVKNLRRRHDQRSIHKYADQPVLSDDIERVDDIYNWFVSLKEEGRKLAVMGKK